VGGQGRAGEKEQRGWIDREVRRGLIGREERRGLICLSKQINRETASSALAYTRFSIKGAKYMYRRKVMRGEGGEGGGRYQQLEADITA